jgi:hypothetical protein
MGLREKISKLLRRRRQYRHAPLQTTAAVELLQTLTVQQRIDALKASHAQTNPLLSAGYKVFSQNDEDGIIQEICRRLSLPHSPTFVEIGVGDGSENNTLNLLSKGWRGIWLGGEPLAYQQLSDRLTFKQCWITRDNVADEIRNELNRRDIASPDLMSLDIDGNDWHIVKSVLEAGITPAVFAVEYNGTFDAQSQWVMPYDAAHVWDKSAYFGASLASFHSLFSQHGYFLAACNATGVNAFFVKNDFKAAFHDLPNNWQLIHMPANYFPYPYLGHPVSQRLIADLLAH